MKKILSVIICLALIVAALPLSAIQASAAKSGNYTYTVSNGKATITEVNTAIKGKVTIPSKLGGYKVTGIGDYAFEFCSSLTSVTIGSSVTSIGEYAFSGCDSLKKVYYRGSRSDKNNITIGSNNGAFKNAIWYYNSCIGYAEHIYDNDCDAQCNDCEYVREGVGHIYDNDCDSNCNICKTFRLTSHQYDNDEDYICNECFNERPPYVIGDISGDGSVDTTDLAVMKLFLAGIGDIDDTVKVAGDMTGDGQINTTDLAQLKLFLAGADSAGSEVLTSEYTTQRFDKSYKNKKGEVLIEHYYDLIQLKGNSEAAQKINNSLKAQMDSFFMSDDELEEMAEGAEYLGPFCYTMDAKVSHNAGGYICVITSYDWYMGGVANFGYYGFTFNLSTGKPASLAELTGKTRISLENEIKTKVIEFFAEEHRYNVVDEIKDYRLDDFEFFIENGEIVIVIPEYDIAPDTVTIKTGISVK